jgi:hypothetical protein
MSDTASSEPLVVLSFNSIENILNKAIVPIVFILEGFAEHCENPEKKDRLHIPDLILKLYIFLKELFPLM